MLFTSYLLKPKKILYTRVQREKKKYKKKIKVYNTNKAHKARPKNRRQLLPAPDQL